MATTMKADEPSRRDFMMIATGAAAAVGVAGVAWPFISQMSPDKSTIAAGSAIEVDLGPVAVGQIITVKWRGKPIFVRHRSQKEIEDAQGVKLDSLPDPATDAERVFPFEGKLAEPWIVVIGICTHLGCVPNGPAGEYEGWYCPCHGSQYDNAGRIRKGPAPKNLALAPVTFISETKIRIG